MIYSHLGLHYFDDKTTDDIFNKLHKILRGGGLIFIKCKSTDDPLFGKGEKIEENMYQYDHTRHFFTEDYMKEKLKDFKIMSLRETTSVYHGNESAFIEAIATK